MRRDLVNIFPRERLKEMDLSSLEKNAGEDIITVLQKMKLFVDRRSDQMFSIVRETIRN